MSNNANSPNGDWKRKYFFDEKTKVVESEMPYAMPCNVSPFVKRDDYKQDQDEARRNAESKMRQNNKCAIA